MKIVDLNEEQLDALRAGNIGAGHASTALAQMIGKKVLINVSKASIVESEGITEAIGGAETMIVGVYLRLLGAAKGNSLLAFQEDHALKLANMMLGKEEQGTSVEVNEERRSALKELGNILIGAYLTALSNFLGLSIICSVPYLAYDMAKAVLDLLAIDMSQQVEHALIIDTEFIISSQKLGGQFLIFFDPESSTKILKALGM